MASNKITDKPTIDIYVDEPSVTTVSKNGKTRQITLSEEYILHCFCQAMYLSGMNFDERVWNNFRMLSWYESARGLFVYEDMVLREMKNPQSSSFKKLEDNFKWIGNTLHCNISVFLGHIETCGGYLDTIYKQAIEAKNINRSLPTIFLIIACHGDELATKLNTDVKYEIFRRHNIAFFGFQDLLHIHEGEIYSTKLPDTYSSSAICDSETILDSFTDFIKDYNFTNDEEDLGPYEVLELYDTHPELDIFKCCRAKLGRLYSDFAKGLERRDTTKYTKESLVKKFKPYTSNSSELSKENTTIVAIDGINCKTNDCLIPNLYEADEIVSQNYNRQGAFHTLFRELKSYLDPSYTYINLEFSTEEEKIDAEEKFMRRIQGLKGKDMSVFLYSAKRTTQPILFKLLDGSFFLPWWRRTSQSQPSKNDYSLFNVVRFIFQKYSSALDFTENDPDTGYTILHQIIYSKVFTVEEEIVLLKTIYDSLSSNEERRRIFFLKDSEGNIPLVIARDIRFPLLCLFYIDKFGSLIRDVEYIFKNETISGNLLHLILLTYIPEKSTEKTEVLIQCVKSLLDLGVDPNKKLIEHNDDNDDNGSIKEVLTLKPLELYSTLYLPPYNTTLFTLFLRYGMTNDTQFFTKQKEFYEGIQKSEEKQASFLKVIRALLGYLVEENTNYDYRKSYRKFEGGMPYRNTNTNNGNASPRSRYSYANSFTNRYNKDKIMNNLTEKEYELYSLRLATIRDFPEQSESIQENMYHFLDSAATTIPETITFFTQILQLRKGVKKHGSKVRRTRKMNSNTLRKTIKNKLNAIQFTINGDKMIGDYVGKILDLAKRKEFTKEEKVNYKKRPLAIQRSELQLKEKYEALKSLYEQMDSVLKTR